LDRAQILDGGDVREGDFGESFGKMVVVQIKRDFDAVALYEHHVVIGNVVGSAVRGAKVEWFEWIGFHPFSHFQECNHGVSLSHLA